ncbi:MAG: hypothetical protein JOZ17_12455 [Acetobacteraceae bacterium]|nr:hypothetical protein [Acetobacteraceae bacterium]
MTSRLLTAVGVACLAAIASGPARAGDETAFAPEAADDAEGPLADPFSGIPPALQAISFVNSDDSRNEIDRDASAGEPLSEAAATGPETRVAAAVSSSKPGRGSGPQVTFGRADGGFEVTVQMPGASEVSVRPNGRELLLTFPHALPQFDASAMQENAGGLIDGINVGFDTVLLMLAPGVSFERTDEAGRFRLALQRSSASAEAHESAVGKSEADEPQAGEDGKGRLRLLDAQLLAQSGQFPEARREFESLVPEMPESPAPLEGLADIAQRTGQWRQSETLYQDALRIDPGDLSAADALAAVERTQSSRVRTDLQYWDTHGGVGTGSAHAVIPDISGHQLLPNGWRVGFSLDMAAINAQQFQEPDGSIRPFSGQRWRGEVYTQHDGLNGNIFGGSLFFNSDTPGFGLRAELPDDHGSTFLNAEYRRPDWDFFQSMIDNGTRSRVAVRRVSSFCLT